VKKVCILASVLLLPILSMAATITNAKILDYGIYTEKTVSTAKLSGAPTATRDLVDNIAFT
jgi:hypothetical protein